MDKQLLNVFDDENKVLKITFSDWGSVVCVDAGMKGGFWLLGGWGALSCSSSDRVTVSNRSCVVFSKIKNIFYFIKHFEKFASRYKLSLRGENSTLLIIHHQSPTHRFKAVKTITKILLQPQHQQIDTIKTPPRPLTQNQ